EGKRTLARDLLAAAHLRRELARVAALEEIERQTLGTARRRFPRKVLMHAALQLLQLAGIARHRVQPRLDARHAMHEEAQVDRRLPRNRVPGHGTAREIQLDARHGTPEHAVEALGGDR